MLEEQISYINNYEDTFFGEDSQESMIMKLNELKGYSVKNSLMMKKYKPNYYDDHLRTCEVIELFRKNKKPIPDVCSFHRPKIRRLMMRDMKFLNTSLDEVNRENNISIPHFKSQKSSNDCHKTRVIFL